MKKKNLVAPGLAIPQGFWGHVYQEGNGTASLILMDAWQSGENNTFFGFKRIWQGGIDTSPIWVMQYSGFMMKEAETLVRKALMMAYSQRLFCNGRGIDEIRGEGFTSYHNENIIDRNIAHYFNQFAGIEKVVAVNPERNGPNEILSHVIIQGRLLDH